MARWLVTVLTIALLGFAQAGRADAPTFEPPPAPTEWVTDNAAFMGEGARSSLNTRLGTYAETSGHQVLVWIAPTTGDVPLEDFTVRTFAKWKVGRKGIDDGIVLFIFAKDHKVRIEVGYGVEDKVPDVVASRIIREQIVPRIRAGDNDGAVTTGAEAIVARLGGSLTPGQQPAVQQPPPGPSLLETVLWAIGLIFIIGFLATHPSLAALFLLGSFGGRRGRGGGFGGGGFGGGGFGGGGFSGGGGSSGGGGASGSW